MHTYMSSLCDCCLLISQAKHISFHGYRCCSIYATDSVRQLLHMVLEFLWKKTKLCNLEWTRHFCWLSTLLMVLYIMPGWQAFWPYLSWLEWVVYRCGKRTTCQQKLINFILMKIYSGRNLFLPAKIIFAKIIFCQYGFTTEKTCFFHHLPKTCQPCARLCINILY